MIDRKKIKIGLMFRRGFFVLTAPRLQGVVRSWNAARGFGFIEGEHHSQYFAHAGNIGPTVQKYKYLNLGEEVEFEPQAAWLNGRSVAINITGPGGSRLQGHHIDLSEGRANISLVKQNLTLCKRCGSYRHTAVDCDREKRPPTAQHQQRAHRGFKN